MRTLGLILLLLFGLQPAQGSFTHEWTDATGTNAVLRWYDAAGYQSRLTTTASTLGRDTPQNPSLSPAPTGSQRRLEFDYDYLGRRIAKRVYVNGAGTPTVNLKFVYDGWNLIAELNEADNSLVRAYIWGLDLSGSLQGAGGTGGLLAVVDATAGTHFAVMDGSGNVAGLVDADTGVRSATYEYDPFGQTIRATGPAADLNPFRFSTRYTDVESGLLYYGYRYYNPSTGRWLTEDPIGEAGGWNLYQSFFNAPTTYVDRNGLDNYYVNPTAAAALSIQNAPVAGTFTMAPVFQRVFVPSVPVIHAPGTPVIVQPDHYEYQFSGFAAWSEFGPADPIGPLIALGVEQAPYVLAGEAAGVVLKGGLACLSIAAKSGPVVIGETMTRVEQAAAKIPGSKILNDMPDFRAMGLNPDQVTSSMMHYNRKWILEQMRSGRQIIDIGADVNRARPSIFYEMEQNMLKNYQKLHPEFNSVTRP